MVYIQTFLWQYEGCVAGLSAGSWPKRRVMKMIMVECRAYLSCDFRKFTHMFHSSKTPTTIIFPDINSWQTDVVVGHGTLGHTQGQKECYRKATNYNSHWQPDWMEQQFISVCIQSPETQPQQFCIKRNAWAARMLKSNPVFNLKTPKFFWHQFSQPFIKKMYVWHNENWWLNQLSSEYKKEKNTWKVDRKVNLSVHICVVFVSYSFQYCPVCNLLFHGGIPGPLQCCTDLRWSALHLNSQSLTLVATQALLP